MTDLARFLPSWTSLLVVPGLIIGFVVHELAHACVAHRLGDNTQLASGRITLNPLRHVFWLGMVTFVLFGFGWARPVRMDVGAFRHRYLGLLLVSISGALANVAIAIMCAATTLGMVMVVSLVSGASVIEVLRLVVMETPAQPDIVAWVAAFTTYVVYANAALAFFNLLPLPGLDGFNVLVGLVGLAKGSPAGIPTVAPHRLNGTPIRSVDGAPRPADIHFERGAAYHAQGNHTDAIARYRQAIASDQHYGPAYVNLGLAYTASGQRERAIHAFRGATQYASDEQSRRVAWAQLHKLSQYSPADSRSASDNDNESEPVVALNSSVHAFRWSAFWGNAALAMAGGACVYAYLTVALIGHFS